jgi:predicted nucleic acid-binding protein
MEWNFKRACAMNGQIENPRIKRLGFDSNTIIDIVNKRYNKAQLEPILSQTKRWFVSVITRIEILSYANLTPDEETKIRAFLKKCRVIPLNHKIERVAIKFRQLTKRKLPDSVIAATAITLGATLITRDAHLLGREYPGLQTISIQ